MEGIALGAVFACAMEALPHKLGKLIKNRLVPDHQKMGGLNIFAAGGIAARFQNGFQKF